MKNRNLMQLFGLLRAAPQRDEKAAKAGKQRFMTQVDSYLAKGKLPVAASKSWSFFSQKKFAMAVMTSLLVLVFLVSSGAGVVAAAQGSLPDATLYPVKTLAEDIRLAFTTDEAKFDLLADYLVLRIDEIDVLYESGSVIPESASNRMASHLNDMLLIAISLDDGGMTQKMVQIQKMVMAAWMKFNVDGDKDRIQDNRPDVPPTKDEARMIAIQKQNRDYLEITIVAVNDPTSFRNILAGINKPAEVGGNGTGSGNGTGTGNGSANQSGNANASGNSWGETSANNFGPGYIISTTISGTEIITTTLPGMWGPGVAGEGLLITDTSLITGKFGPGPDSPLFYSWGQSLYGNEAMKQLQSHNK